MAETVRTNDLVGTDEVAELLELNRANNVAVIVKRHPDFPAPIYRSASGHCQVWHRPDVVAWIEQRTTKRKGR